MQKKTPLSIIGSTCTRVTRMIDRLTGSRANYPLLVSATCVEALRAHGIGSRIHYGDAAWIEVLENDTPAWAGFWSPRVHFWLETEHGELVDLNTSVAHRMLKESNPELGFRYSPPLLWSHEVPRFYRYSSHGIAEIELKDERDIKWLNRAFKEIKESANEDVGFPDEPLICHDRKLLDDSRGSFKNYDRALAAKGIPEQLPF